VTEPFFIIGFQRSGTTLLRLMLDNHPDLAIPLDTVGLWAKYEDRLAEYAGLATEADARRLITALLAEERIRLWEVPLTVDGILALRQRAGFPGIVDAFHLGYAAAKGKRAWGDKDPGNMERLDRISRWFPACKVIHIVRDGRDACLSQQQQNFGIQDLFDCACAWREQVEWVRRIGGILGTERYFELRYEDLVTDAAPILEQLCRFLGVTYSPQMLEYHRDVKRSVPDEKRHIWPLLDMPPQKDAAGRWKKAMSHGERVGFEKRAGSMLRAMDYETLPELTGAARAELGHLVGRALAAVKRRIGMGH
jgi:hypothetical protein